MKRIPIVLASLLLAASPVFGESDEELRWRDLAGRAFDEAAAANETARQLELKVDQQAARIATLEGQLDEINRAAQAKQDAEEAAKAAAARAVRQQAADAAWAAGAPDRASQAAALQAAVDQWRASIKRTPAMIIVPNKTTGGASVSIDGKITEFLSLAEATAFAAQLKQKALAMDTRGAIIPANQP
jgi:hypothetical protein